MHCRLFFVFLLHLWIIPGFAESGVWNCDEATSDDWSCFNQAGSKKIEKSKSVQSQLASAKSISLPASDLTSGNPDPKPGSVYVQPPKTVARQLGWNCTPNEEDGTWSCSLSGPDPKGKARYIGEEEYSSGLFADAFDYKQEQIFETLHSQLKYNPWQSCTTSSRSKLQYIPGKHLRNTAPMDVTADYSEVFDKEIASFFGNVKMIRADQRVFSDAASYDSVSETMDVRGHVFYNEDELSLYSDTALLNLATDEVRLRKALFISPSAPIRGTADVVYRDSASLSRYKTAVFTSCPPGNRDWVMHADRLKMNKLSGRVSAKHAWLEVFGLPVLYSPYISFPLDDRRLSGILAPSWGNSDDTGVDVSLPYYWNIAPNYDLTITPRYMSKRGGMLSTNFRYLLKKTSGSLGLEYLPYDSVRKKSRHSGSFKNSSQFTSNLNSNVDLNYVSDKKYFDELNGALGISTSRHLGSMADLNYSRPGVSFLTHLETYQTIDRNLTDAQKSYSKLPQVTLNLEHTFKDWSIDLAMENEHVYFYRSGRVTGHRFNTKPSITFPLETAGSFFKPKFSLQHTQYFLQNQKKGKKGKTDDINRTLPIFSVDSGLIFEKDFKFSESGYQHTIEPRLFYLFIPKEGQDDIPLFDSSLYDLNYSSLFRENRFSSVDRVQEANQVTVAMKTRLIDSENGKERLNLSVGEIFYFRDREVALTKGKVETNNSSNVVAELSGRLTDYFKFSSAIQWNPYANDVTRGQARIRYRNRNLPDQIINLGWRYRKDDLKSDAETIQTDASFRWPIYDSWRGVGRWLYSHKFNSTKESFLGLEKESCCWRFRVVWRRYIDKLDNVVANNKSKMEEGVFIQLELKGLTNLGDKAGEFLEQNLPGYQRAE